ncbi:AMP-binding protein [Paenibacillus larvae]|nr:AMP-binding protein [Paenibacillus larvae]MDT2236974.1 AMP-binding protein [Paenibacillus larvae]
MRLAAVLCERFIPMLVGILGLFKAGGAYVPIDAAYPMERIRTMLSDSGASIVLTVSAVFAGSDEMYRGIVAGTSVEHIVYLDRRRLNRTKPCSGRRGRHRCFLSGANPSCRVRKWRFVPATKRLRMRYTGNAPDSLPVFLRIVSVTKEMVRVCCWTIHLTS